MKSIPRICVWMFCISYEITLIFWPMYLIRIEQVYRMTELSGWILSLLSVIQTVYKLINIWVFNIFTAWSYSMCKGYYFYSHLCKVGFKRLETTFNSFQCFSEKKSFIMRQFILTNYEFDIYIFIRIVLLQFLWLYHYVVPMFEWTLPIFYEAHRKAYNYFQL